jgi:GntP family gluconate:H+ symporter
LGSMGLLFPFLLTSVLKTAQGSSTVAIMTAVSLVLPLLPALGLNTEIGRLLCVLAMGAGSMMISHTNDAYFWVIAKFSGLEMKTMLKVYSVATLFMGLTTFAMVYILSKLL